MFLEHLFQSKSSLRSELVHFLGDFLGLLSNALDIEWKDGLILVLDAFVNSLGRVGESSVTSFEDFLTSRKDDELVNVLFESLDVSLERLIGFIGSSGVDGDTDRSGVVLVESDGLDFLKSESSTLSNLARISLGWLMDQRSKFGQRSRENG